MKDEVIDQILDKNAHTYMFQWSLRGFKRTFPRLYKTILATVKEVIEINSKIK